MDQASKNFIYVDGTSGGCGNYCDIDRTPSSGGSFGEGIRAADGVRESASFVGAIDGGVLLNI
jgi:hypothetical protein